MKNTLSILFILIIGYCLYPLLNSTETNASANNSKLTITTKANKLVSPPPFPPAKKSEHISQPVNNMQDILNAQPNSSSDSSEQSNNSPMTTLDNINLNAQQTKFLPHLEPEEYERQTQNFVKWSDDHKNELDTVIDSYLSGDAADYFKTSILKSNDLYENQTIEQDETDDEIWSYLMEQDINALIMQHEHNNAIDLITVTCKQLICEIILIENQPGFWWEIYKSLRMQLPNVQRPTEGNRPRNITNSQSDIKFLYSQIKFINKK